MEYTKGTHMKRFLHIAASLAALVLAATGIASAEPAKGGVIDVATIGEPPTLDPMASTADLVGIITQHIYETLYTFDKDWGITPLLAAEHAGDLAPTASSTPSRCGTGVKFHDGSDMNSADVVASLQRWMKIATRGKQAAGSHRFGRCGRRRDGQDHAEEAVRAAAGAAVAQQRRRHHHAVGECRAGPADRALSAPAPTC